MPFYVELFDLNGTRTAARRTTDGAIVPIDARNSDWRDFIAWDEAGRPEIWPPVLASTP